MDIKNTLMGMLLIMLSTVVNTEASQGTARGASAARIKATVLRAQTIRARTMQGQPVGEAQSGRVQDMSPLGMRAPEKAHELEARGSSTATTTGGTISKGSELGEARALMQARREMPAEAKAQLEKQETPPLPPKRARISAVAPIAAPSPAAERQPEQPAEHQETWGEMFARHGDTLLSHLGAD